MNQQNTEQHCGYDLLPVQNKTASHSKPSANSIAHLGSVTESVLRMRHGCAVKLEQPLETHAGNNQALRSQLLHMEQQLIQRYKRRLSNT